MLYKGDNKDLTVIWFKGRPTLNSKSFIVTQMDSVLLTKRLQQVICHDLHAWKPNNIK